ncbi:MAG: OmpA family protein [Bacteroidia bacterium]
MKIKLLILLFFSSVLTEVFSQNIEIQKGDIRFEFFQFKDAAADYEAALRYNNPKVETYLLDRLAQCYKYSFQYKKAQEYFSKLVRLGDKNTNPEVYLDYAAILKINDEYTHAREQYMYYFTLFPNDPYATKQLKSLSWAESHKDSSRNFKLTLTNLDIDGQSLGYCFFENGLVYSTQRNKIGKGNPILMFDIDYAEMKDSTTFTEGERYFDRIDFSTNEGSPSISDDGMLIYFSANAVKLNNPVKVKQVGNIQISSDGISNMKIYVARFENGKFMNPQELPFNDKEYDCMHPCIADNGNTLYFASDMPKGYGGLDLYKVTRGADGKWGKPENLGPNVNTSENEIFPYVMNNVLFFASKGFNGYGGYDLFQAKIHMGIPTGAANMGKPFNSTRDDVAFICRPDGRSGYFSSNRDNTDGIDKVYYFIDNNLLNQLANKDLASNEKTSVTDKPLAAVKMDDPKQPSKENIIIQKINDGTPIVANTRNAKDKKADRRNGHFDNSPISDEELMKVSFEKVNFKFNDAAIPPSSYYELDSAIRISKISKSVKIEIHAYTDCRGTSEYNQKLSERRAATAKNYLLKKGVPASRIVTHGYGETHLLNNCTDGTECTEEQHAVNRRVEIRIVK